VGTDGLRDERARRGEATLLRAPRPGLRATLEGMPGIPVVTGYLALDPAGQLTTLGPNGSDLTAVWLGEAVAAVKAAGGNKFKMGGTGSKQEDQIITVAIEKAAGVKFTYIPFKGGGDVAVQLVGKHIDSSVNNPIEAVAQWRAGALRPLCVFDDTPMPYKAKVTDTMSWSDIPPCKAAGVGVDYLMLRGIFMPAGVTKDQVDFYVDLFKKVRETADWKKFMEDGAFNTTFMTGPEYAKWVENAENTHKTLMKEAGFLAP